jgi:hypothetical protein
MLLGNHPWTFIDDINCNKGKIVDMSVSLTLCQPSDFNCDDGGCIDLYYKCDGTSNCQDGSDEMYCTFVQLPADYNNQLSPQIAYDQTRVNVSFEVIDLLDIAEKTGKVRVKFMLGTTWNDFRLMFLDLWMVYDMNLLSKTEMEKIWHPIIKFENAELANFDYNVDAQIYVKRYETDENIVYSHPKELLNSKVFQGSRNSLYWAASIR